MTRVANVPVSEVEKYRVPVVLKALTMSSRTDEHEMEVIFEQLAEHASA